jgi:hypothetical protein
MKEYQPTYWNDKGKYQKEYDLLSEIMIPMRGDSATKQGQLLRAISNFYHERYNNGHCNPIGVYTKYIRKYCASHGLMKVHVFLKMSDKALDKTVDEIVKHLMGTVQEPLEASDSFYND